MKTTINFLVAASLVVLLPQSIHARGFGGGFHGGGGGGGYHAGGFEAGGYHAGGAEAGGFHAGGAEAGGYHAGGVEAGGYHAGGAEAGGYHAGGVEAGGYHAGGVEAGGYHAGGVEAGGYHAAGYGGYGTAHAGLPTDGAFGRNYAGMAGYGHAAHATTAWSNSVAVARGTAVRGAYGDYGAFGRGWYTAHPGAWAAAGWATGAAWNAATWPAVGAWCGWDNTVQPVVYQYGDNITYQGDEVYYGSQPVATADQYYDQAAAIAESVPAPPAPATPAPAEPQPQASDWLPLGVFSLVQGDQTDTSSIFQLAVGKSGAIAGNYYSALTGITLPVHGAVDKKTQRAAWTTGDSKTTVYEAGISSLAENEAPILVHFGKERTQQWMLVRLKQPQASAGDK